MTLLNNDVKLLIVDDEINLCELIKKALSSMSDNYLISTAYNGTEAVKLLAQEPFDVLVTDIRMPGMDGLQLLEEARNLQEELQSIVITGHGDMDYAIKALQIGAINFIKKPISFEILHFSIEKAVEKLILKRKLLENEEKFRGAFMNAPTGMIIFEPTGEFVEVNQTICYMLQYSESELMGKGLDDITHKDDVESLNNNIQLLLKGDIEHFNIERRYIRKDGEVLWGVANFSVLPNPDKNRSDLIIQIVDITERKEAERSLQIEKTFLDKLFESAPEGMVLVDNSGTIKNINAEFTHMFGYGREEAMGKNIDLLLAPADKITEAQKITESVGGGQRQRFETTRYRKDGSPVIVSIIGAPVKYGDGQLGVYGIYRDISSQKEAERKLEYQARNDQLTGLYNRRSFFDRLDQELHYAKRYNESRALIFLDLDNFKQVNDQFGHKAGDLLLKEVAARLRHTLRESDVIYRLGGDEFVVLVNNQFESQPVTVSQRINKALAQPYEVEGQKIDFVSASIGISVFPVKDDEVSKILSRADAAMYSAKKKGRNRFVFYNDSME